MKKKSIVYPVILLLAVFFLQGCLYDITSIVVPASTSTGKVITFVVTRYTSEHMKVTSNNGTAARPIV